MKSKRIIVALVLVLLIVALAIAGGFALRHFALPSGAPEEPASEQPSVPTEKVDRLDDAAAYFEQNSQVIETIYAPDSPSTMTEESASSELRSRGFGDCVATTEYSMDGEYYEADEISSSSSSKHPTYECTYITPDGDAWTIMLYNGMIMANPVSYNLGGNAGDVMVIVSESESVMSYDSASNCFFHTIPNPDALKVLKVDRIDAATLDSLTPDKIGGQL